MGGYRYVSLKVFSIWILMRGFVLMLNKINGSGGTMGKAQVNLAAMPLGLYAPLTTRLK